MGKMLFFDVDGTLYNSQKKLPQSAKLAIQKAREKGFEIAIATGRAPFMIETVLRELEIDTYVCFNGQYVVYKDEVIFTDGVARERLAELIAFGEQRGEPVVFLGANEMVASVSKHVGVEQSLRTLKYPYPRVDEQFYQKKDVFQTLLYVTEEDEHVYLEKFPDVQLVRWHPLSCDVLPQEGSKARGIHKLLEHIGRPVEDTIAFGDGLNDVEMLQAVGVGVAMGNGHVQALQAADIIAPHVDEDGLAKIMKQLQLT